MSSQPSFPFQPERTQKRIAETSRESYAEVKKTMTPRHVRVLRSLSSYLLACKHEPTASELMRYMGLTDPNAVRPRLTEMKDERMGLRYVLASEKPRRCTVTNKNVCTWRPSPRGELYLRDKK